jgi:hypothetical protein
VTGVQTCALPICEIIFAAAPLLAELLRGQKAINISDISVPQQGSFGRSPGFFGWPWLVHPFLRHPKEIIFFLEEILPRYGWILGNPLGGSGFLGNAHFCRDVHDFTRDWTQLNIGEPTYAFDHVVNSHVDAFANFMLRRIRYEHVPELPADNVFGDAEFEGSLAVLVIHVDVEREE